MRTSIAVLDSNVHQRKATIGMIDEYSRHRPDDIICQGFESGPDLLGAIKYRGQFDIYILETLLPHINGFYVARELRSMHNTCKIIYYTQNTQAALTAFEVGADNYVLKPASPDRFSIILDDAIDELRREEKTVLFNVKVREGYTRLCADDVAYVNIEQRMLCFHMTDGSVIPTPTLREPFRNATKQLVDHPDFALGGPSLLVNLDKVRSFTEHTIIFDYGEALMPSHNAYKAILQRWLSRPGLG